MLARGPGERWAVWKPVRLSEVCTPIHYSTQVFCSLSISSIGISVVRLKNIVGVLFISTRKQTVRSYPVSKDQQQETKQQGGRGAETRGGRSWAPLVAGLKEGRRTTRTAACEFYPRPSQWFQVVGIYSLIGILTQKLTTD